VSARSSSAPRGGFGVLEARSATMMVLVMVRVVRRGLCHALARRGACADCCVEARWSGVGR